MSLLGTYIMESPFLCQLQSGGFLRFKRPHRRPRIAKKWRRFGVVTKPCPGVAYEMAGVIYACPHAMSKIRKACQ